ncbi:uncharacterized protein LOC135583304 isoform X3 [Musa acuminata AAA Group]|uniref:uncharacterized protein LOC103991468 isoform X3 n=1 Tax=Musa acuminata AAA Group TaxID=214697 RepID=UPI0031DB71EA
MAAESPTAERKVVVHLRATGDAPILKQAKFKSWEFYPKTYSRFLEVTNSQRLLNFFVGNFIGILCLFISTAPSLQTLMNW